MRQLPQSVYSSFPVHSEKAPKQILLLFLSATSYLLNPEAPIFFVDALELDTAFALADLALQMD
jgi:hypothetical protein